MKATFNDFVNLLEPKPIYKKFDGDANAMLIFEVLSRDSSIIQMIEATEKGLPALAPCARQLEEILAGIKHPTISFDDDFTKQAVGTMVKVILKPFGYVKRKKDTLPKDAGAEQFMNASCYYYDPESAPPTMRISKHVAEI